MATPEVAAQLAKAETENTGIGPVSGGDAAAAQSLLDKEKNLAVKVKEVTNKASEEVTKEDARELQSAQDRVLGSSVRTPASLVAQAQSQADQNGPASGGIRDDKAAEAA